MNPAFDIVARVAGSTFVDLRAEPSPECRIGDYVGMFVTGSEVGQFLVARVLSKSGGEPIVYRVQIEFAVPPREELFNRGTLHDGPTLEIEEPQICMVADVAAIKEKTRGLMPFLPLPIDPFDKRVL